MYFAKQTIALATLAMTLGSALAMAAYPAQVNAEIIRQGRSGSAPASPTVQPQRPTRLAIPMSVTGDWQGGMHSAGDDAVSSLALQMTGNGSTYQGTWQLLGADENLDEGSLSASKQGNTITLELEGFNGNQSIVLTGTVNANGTAMSGQVVNSSFVFSFTKS